MLHIEHDTDPRPATKQYADGLWAANPRLSPDWWRELQGHTVGKLALDWRTTCHQPDYLNQGCNLVLVSPATAAQAAQHIQAAATPAAIVTIIQGDDLTVLAQSAATFALWQQPANLAEHQRHSGLQQLEDAVRQGHIQAYGVVLGPACTHPLHLWLNAAAEAAQTVYGRRKRPALRLLGAQQDLLHLDLFTHPSTLHHAEAVSALELASRLGLSTLLLPLSLPQVPPATPPAAALQALTAAAQAEASLNQALGGWPQTQGQPLFSLLAALGQGQPPWPTPWVWQAWQAHVWPTLLQQWQALALAGPADTARSSYITALENLLPHAAALAEAAAQPLQSQMLASLTPRLPMLWQTQPPQAQALAILSGLAGADCIAVARPFALESFRLQPGLPDAAALLLNAA